jgi:hypothetical protein
VPAQRASESSIRVILTYLRRVHGTVALVVSVASAACSTSAPLPTPTPDGSVECPKGDSLTMTQLPTGKPCSPEAPPCTLTASGLCGDASNFSIVNAWECGCKNEVWECVITSRGGGVCPDYGPFCGARLPTFGLTESCYGCCEPGDGCFLDGGSAHVACYCNCDPKDAACFSKCDMARNSGVAPNCLSCFSKLEQCGRGSCAAECKGQSFPDAGSGPADAPTDARGVDATMGGEGG